MIKKCHNLTLEDSKMDLDRKYSKQALDKAVEILLPNISIINNTEGMDKIRVPELVKLAGVESLTRNETDLTYEERLAFHVFKVFALQLKNGEDISFGSREFIA